MREGAIKEVAAGPGNAPLRRNEIQRAERRHQSAIGLLFGRNHSGQSSGAAMSRIDRPAKQAADDAPCSAPRTRRRQ